MPTPETYAIGPQVTQVSQALGLDPARVLRRARLPSDFLEHDQRGVTAAQFFAVWEAVEAEANRPDLPLYLGQIMARSPMIPAIYGFASSPDIETGFARLAVFKPLVAPIRLISERDETSLTLRWAPPPGIAPSPLFSFFELVYFLALCRSFTGAHIVPLGIGAPVGDNSGLREFFGVTAHVAPVPELRLSHTDASRRMIFANDEQYRVIEADLRRQLNERARSLPMTTRVQRTLVDILPAGEATVDAVCDRLAMSRRSLQRKLKDEGENFQSVLEATRAELSMHYLKHADMSVQEISYLLAYRDPNSFYRAFQGWTGMTPGQARADLP